MPPVLWKLEISKKYVLNKTWALSNVLILGSVTNAYWAWNLGKSEKHRHNKSRAISKALIRADRFNYHLGIEMWRNSKNHCRNKIRLESKNLIHGKLVYISFSNNYIGTNWPSWNNPTYTPGQNADPTKQLHWNILTKTIFRLIKMCHCIRCRRAEIWSCWSVRGT